MGTVKMIGCVSNTRGMWEPGDIVTAPDSDLQPLVDSGSAEWVGGNGPQVDRATWAWNVSEAREHIESEIDLVTLRAWHAGEHRNPKFPPTGRKGIRDAIEERMGELNIVDPAEGLARGPEA